MADTPRQVGRYKVRGLIASGGQGSVYDGYDPERRLDVAIKTVRWRDVQSEAALRREFRLASEIFHPNLVRLYELFEADGALYVTMERLVPTPLGEWWGERGPAAPDRLHAAVRQLAVGVATLHAAGLLHLDLKPSNALVQPDGRVVLIDFGIAARLGETHEVPTGTPGYMAPELFERRPLDVGVDWYAFGVILHDALTGRRLRDDVVAHDPRTYHRDADPVLCELAVALVRSDAARRPSGDEVLVALGLSPVRTRPSPFFGRAAELERLDRLVESAAVGRPTCVTLSGPSGIGKSGLLDALARRHGSRATLLHLRCSERDAAPYKVLDPMVDDVVRALATRALGPDERAALAPLAAVFPAAGRLGARWERVEPPQRRQVAAALATALTQLALHAPLLCLVDDAQWADPESAAVLGEALGEAPGLPLLVVAVVRDATAPGPLVVGLGLPAASIVLGALAADDAREWALAEGAPLDTSAAGLDPFVLRMTFDGVAAGQTVQDALRERVGALGPTARETLACIVFSSFRLTPLHLARLGRPVDPLLDGLHEARLARARGFGAGATLEVVHDRIRAWLTETFSRADQVAAHENLLALMADDDDLAARAVHELGAGHVREGAATARRAGLAALRLLAFERAAELLTLAVDHSQAPPAALHAELGEALEGAGRCAEAARAYEAALPELPELRLRAARMHFFSGGLEPGLAAARPVLQEFALALPESGEGVTSALIVGIVRAAVGAGGAPMPARSRVAADVEDGLVSLEPMRAGVLLLATAPGDLRGADPALRCLASSRLGLFWAGLGWLSRGTRMQLAAEATVGALAPAVRLKVLVNRAKLSLIAGDFPAALSQADAATALTEAHHLEPVLMPSVARNIGLFACAAIGDLPELRGRIAQARRCGHRVGDRCAEVTAGIYEAFLALAAGDPEEARARVDRSLAQWPLRRYTFQHWLADRNRAFVALYAGDRAAAAATVAAARVGLVRSRMAAIPFIASDYLRLRVLAGERSIGVRWALHRAARGNSAHAAAARALRVALGGSRSEAVVACRAADLRLHVAALETTPLVAGVADPTRWRSLYVPDAG